MINKFVFLILFLLQYITLYAQDTLFLKRNTIIYDNKSRIESVENIELESIGTNFNGILVIKIDDSSKLVKGSTNKYLFETEVYFVDSVSRIVNPKYPIYYTTAFTLITDLNTFLYENGEINKLTAFAKYYSVFNRTNPKANVFLYHGNDILLTDLLLDSANLVMRKTSPKVYYKIYKCNFSTAILKQNNDNSEARTFIPISDLKEFISLGLESLNEDLFLQI